TGWSRNRQSVTRIDVEARTTNQPAVAWDPAAETACPDERGCLRDGVRRPIRGTGSRVGWTHILDGHARSHRAPVPVFREAPGRIPLELLVWGHGDYPPRRHPTSPAPRMTSGSGTFLTWERMTNVVRAMSTVDRSTMARRPRTNAAPTM